MGMAVARQLLAALLAILIANPACCCTIGTVFGKAAAGNDSAPTRSCCSKKKDSPGEQSPQSPGERHQCPCTMDASMVVEAKLTKLDRAAPLEIDWEFPVRLEILPVATLEHPRIAHRFDLPPPPASWRLHCRYLL